MTIDAVERNFEIIGEAAGQLPQAVKGNHSKIVWYGVISFRNRLIHKYFSVDYQTLWHILQNELSVLRIQLQTIADSQFAG